MSILQAIAAGRLGRAKLDIDTALKTKTMELVNERRGEILNNFFETRAEIQAAEENGCEGDV